MDYNTFQNLKRLPCFGCERQWFTFYSRGDIYHLPLKTALLWSIQEPRMAFSWGPFPEVDSGEWVPRFWRYHTLASITVCPMCHSNPFASQRKLAPSGIAGWFLFLEKLTWRKLLEWTRAPVISAALMTTIHHLPPTPPILDTLYPWLASLLG